MANRFRVHPLVIEGDLLDHPVLPAGGLFEVGDAPMGRCELMLEADDADGCGQWHILIKQFTDLHRQGKIGPAITTLPARGATWAQQSSGIQAAHKCGLHTEQLRSCTHGIGRVVNIIELFRDTALVMSVDQRGPGGRINTTTARAPQRGGLS